MGNEINFNESLQKINDYLQAQKGSGAEEKKNVTDVDIENIFAEITENGANEISPKDFAVAFAEKYLEKEIDDVSELDTNYIKAWKEIATYDENDDSISFDEVQEVLDGYKESQLPKDWKVKDGIVSTPDGQTVEAKPKLEEGHTINDKGEILDKDKNIVGIVADIEKDTNGDDVDDNVQSYYYYTEKSESKAKTQSDVAEKAVTKDEALANGNKVNDKGEIVDKEGNIVGHVEVSYVDATGDGVTDKVTSYYLYSENTKNTEDKTNLPDGWAQNNDGTITDDEGNNLGKRAVQAEDLEAIGYKIDEDGYIYDKDNNKVGRNIETNVDVDGDGIADTAHECYLYADTKAEKPEGFPSEWTINKDGTITDENGNVLGGEAAEADDLINQGYTISEDGYIYPPNVESNDPADAVGRVYTVETKNKDGEVAYAQVCHLDVAHETQNLPLSGNSNKDKDGVIKDENGQSMSVVEPDDKSLEGLTKIDGEYYNEYGQLVAITDENGSIYKYDELPELNLVAKPKDEALPENYHIDDEGNIIDDDTGFITGRIEVYFEDATGDGVTDKITSYYVYEEEQAVVQEDTPSTAEAPTSTPVVVDNPTGTPTTEELPETVPSAETPSDTPSVEEAQIVEDVPSSSEIPSTETEENIPILMEGSKEDAEEATISDEVAAIYASQLYEATAAHWGTDEKQVTSILENKDLSQGDIAKIIYAYNEKHGSIVNAIDGDFSGKDNTKYQQIIADALLTQIENGDEKALEILCKEFYNATEGKVGTSEPFIERIFENTSYETLAKIALEYGNVNNGADIFKAIKGDFSGSKENDFIQKLNDALAKCK